jgi:hypothetical protein
MEGQVPAAMQRVFKVHVNAIPRRQTTLNAAPPRASFGITCAGAAVD